MESESPAYRLGRFSTPQISHVRCSNFQISDTDTKLGFQRHPESQWQLSKYLCCRAGNSGTRGVPRERFAEAKKNEDHEFAMRFFSTHESITHANTYANGEQNANENVKTALIHGFCSVVRVMNPMGIPVLNAILHRVTKHFLNS